MSNKIITELNNYLSGFSALFYPTYCVICERELGEHEKHFCFRCEQELEFTHFEKYKETSIADEVFWGRVPVERVFSLLYFVRGNSTQKILHTIKYKQGRDLAVYMGKVMGEKLKTHPDFSTIDAVIPIPLHSKKAFLRGYNQSYLIAKGLEKSLGVEVVEALYRKTHDESQTRKNREERYENIKNKFAIENDKLLHQRHVLIVDDVLTTGATLEFAVRAILTAQHPVKVSLATIAMAH